MHSEKNCYIGYMIFFLLEILPIKAVKVCKPTSVKQRLSPVPVRSGR